MEMIIESWSRKNIFFQFRLLISIFIWWQIVWHYDIWIVAAIDVIS